jgi:cardiolipin synthase
MSYGIAPACRGAEQGHSVTIPNLITIGRLVLVPLIVWLMITGQPAAAFIVFILAGVSDGVDGFLARSFNLRSALGSYLDPLADKALLVSIYISLAVLEEVPLWVVFLVVSRDLFIVGAVVLSWMLGQPMEMRPLIISKINTVVQIVLAAVALGALALGLDLSMLRAILAYLVGMLTVASATVYLIDWVRHMGGSAAGSPGPPSGEGHSQ